MSIIFGIFVGVVACLMTYAFYKEYINRRMDYLEDKILDLITNLETKNANWEDEREKL